MHRRKKNAMDHRPIVSPLGRILRACAALALLGVSAAHAEDVDLFLNNPINDSARPNILLMVDNAASNNSVITQLPNATGTKKLDMIKDVLHILTDPLNSPYFPSCAVSTVTVGDETREVRSPVGCITRAEANSIISKVNLGLMMFAGGSVKGGYVRSHIRRMDVAANRTTLWSKVSGGIPSANNAPYAKMMHEAYLYFSAGEAYQGFATSQFDPEARSTTSTTRYAPVITDACQSNSIILLGTGGPDSNEDGDARVLLNGLGGVLTSDPISFSPTNYMSNWTDEYGRTLYRNDVASAYDGKQNVITYTVAIQSPSDNDFNTAGSRSARALLQSTANQGGGEYVLGQDGQAVLNAVLNAIRKMLPQNSVFAAVTLPVSVNVRGTFLNQVYMGQFRPDINARAHWPGNLKQYQIAVTPDGAPYLSDRGGVKNAEDTTNGFLKSDITSFWTRASSFWSGPTFVNQNMTASDAPDGSIVEKGGTAQRQRMDFATATGRAARNLYTCNGGACAANSNLSSILFNTSNSSIKTQLGLSTTAEQDELIEWVRGVDNKDENGDGVLTDVRAYLHGDLLHSRPAVVNYNRTTGNRDVLVYYGANDGLFRAVKGGQDDADGYEKWGMVFPEFLPKLATIRANDRAIGPGLTDFKKPYFADGPVSVYQHDVNSDGRLVAADGDKVWLYVAMRRGGRFIYALDVSDPDTPKFMWKIDNTTSSGGNAVFADLGQTWSTVRPAVIRNQTGPVLIFGGGYDPTNEDPNPALAGNVMGNAIFVVDARTGTYIHRITHPDMGAITADLTLLDRDGDGKTDRIYAVDTKANLWRVDIDNASVASWTIHKLASLGGTGADARKFLNKPDVVLGKTFDAVLVGAGDREHPFEEGIVDRFYMVKDKFLGLAGGLSCGTTASPATCTHADLVDVTSNQLQGGTLPADKQGWYITFRSGEKMVSSPVTVYGNVIFGTNQRVAGTSLNSCYNLGVARLYQVDFLTGGAVSDLNADGVIDVNDRSEEVKGGGFLPSAVYSPVVIDGKRRDVVCVGTRCFKPGGQAFDTSRTRTYWYKK